MIPPVHRARRGAGQPGDFIERQPAPEAGHDRLPLLDRQTGQGFRGGGGIQAIVTPPLGAIALWDGTDEIIGLTYTPKPTGPTYKGGVFGKHFWMGVEYTFTH